MTLTDTIPELAAPAPAAELRLESIKVVRRDRLVLDGIDLAVHRGELVAIAGASGAGKTTLLKIIAGFLEPSSGIVRRSGATSSSSIGYVPQDDIVPLDLTVEQVLESAAALRLSYDAAGRTRRVDDVIARLGLGHLRESIVRVVSGGERKRVNVAVELLGVPDILLLDEPTSGLDPASAATLLAHLRELAAAGTTVLLTTHAPSDIGRCDRVVFLGRDGRIAYDGPPRSAPSHFAVNDVEGIYLALEETERVHVPVEPGRRRARPYRACSDGCAPATSLGTQVRTLARRNAAVLARNRLSLAILVGSPILVTAMMVCLFPVAPGVPDASSAAEVTQVAYWMVFDAFFFGLTYGLLQVVPEMAILRRDRVAGVRLDAYVAAKLIVLTPLLVMSTTVMALTLLAFDRLPDLSASAVWRLLAMLSLTAVAALAIGLLASAAVVDTTQATLALPMICFPQVLFAGAVVARSAMAFPARAMSQGLVTRWSFDGALSLFSESGSFHGSSISLATCVLALGVIAVSSLLATVLVLRRRSDPAR